MSDDDIIERGGTQEDIDAYAHDVGGACGAAYGGSCDYCGKVTPTEQDKELEAQLDKIFPCDCSFMKGFAFRPGDTCDGSCVNAPYKKAVLELITADRKRVELEARIDPFEFVESCEPDCDDVRHAYHQGQWDMATRIKAQQEEV